MEYRSTLLILALAATGALIAQPNLDLDSNGPVPIGAPYAITSFTTDVPAEFAPPGLPGADQDYGFWMLPATGNQDRYYVDPNVTGTSTSFPGATVLYTNGGQDTSFYKVDANGMELLGVRGSLEGISPYTNGALELKFPCTFGTTWTDSFTGSYAVGPYPVNRSGTISAVADGYGQIELPAQVIPSVLRVYMRKVQLDLSAVANITRTYDTYYYYQEGLPYPVMKTSQDSVTVGTGAPTVSFTAEWLYGPGMVGVEEIAASDILFTPYPNPTNGLVDLQIGNEELNSIEVLSTTGQIVFSKRMLQRGNGSGIVDLTGMPSGVYHVRITNRDGRVGNRRIVLN